MVAQDLKLDIIIKDNELVIKNLTDSIISIAGLIQEKDTIIIKNDSIFFQFGLNGKVKKGDGLISIGSICSKNDIGDDILILNNYLKLSPFSIKSYFIKGNKKFTNITFEYTIGEFKIQKPLIIHTIRVNK